MAEYLIQKSTLKAAADKIRQYTEVVSNYSHTIDSSFIDVDNLFK
jgi:hypothetical protein